MLRLTRGAPIPAGPRTLSARRYSPTRTVSAHVNGQWELPVGGPDHRHLWAVVWIAFQSATSRVRVHLRQVTQVEVALTWLPWRVMIRIATEDCAMVTRVRTVNIQTDLDLLVVRASSGEAPMPKDVGLLADLFLYQRQRG